ncbi:UDP-N-acetylmuramate dehydrogenase, partial [Sulfurimonas sp. MAG313]|nr:UDP-N-acetylmuramate dehydrogenase [Sulfurimonas sp. MAG313]
MIKEIDFSKHSSLKIGPIAQVHILHDTNYPKDRYVLGQCNNVLIGPQHPPLMILGKEFDYIKIEDNLLCVGAATPSGKLLSFCKKYDIKNFELLPKLPGNIG